MKIGLLRTTKGSEVWVSDSTVEFYRKYIQELGHDIVDIYITEDIGNDIKLHKVDLIFNATLGKYGEDGRISAVLDLLKIPYTHSDYISSGITFDKLLTKIFFSCYVDQKHLAQYVIVNREQLLNNSWKEEIKKHTILKDKKSFFIKPLREGSTIDSWKINLDTDFNKFNFISSCTEYLIEELIVGKDMCVGILNDKQIGIMEIRHNSDFFDYTTKYTAGLSTHHLPELNKDFENKILQTCENIHRAIGLNCLSRFDLLVTEDNFYILEINANPAMTPMSLFPDLMRLKNIDLSLLTKSLIETAKFRDS